LRPKRRMSEPQIHLDCVLTCESGDTAHSSICLFCTRIAVVYNSSNAEANSRWWPGASYLRFTRVLSFRIFHIDGNFGENSKRNPDFGPNLHPSSVLHSSLQSEWIRSFNFFWCRKILVIQSICLSCIARSASISWKILAEPNPDSQARLYFRIGQISHDWSPTWKRLVSHIARNQSLMSMHISWHQKFDIHIDLWLNLLEFESIRSSRWNEQVA
jgi:hypothetical protein